MKIITVQFNYRNTMFERLLTAFRNSINLHMPETGLTEYIYDFDKTKTNLDRCYSVITNTFKLDKWVEILEEEKENICFSDCDMLMVNPIDDVWEYDFDVAFTARRRWKKTGQGIPYNGGVVFVRPNERSINFFKRWAEVNRQMVHDPAFHADWRKKYAGMNQSAFGYIMEKENDICNFKELPCPIWNSVDESWTEMDNSTKMVHIKSHLRRCCMGSNNPNMRLQRVVDLWEWYESLDKNKKIIYDKSLNCKWDGLELKEAVFPLTIIVPKLNDPDMKKKIQKSLKSYDQLIVLKNVKQNYKMLLKKSMHENVVFINPSNFRLINNPLSLEHFRVEGEFLFNNNNRVDRSSIKVQKSKVEKMMSDGVTNFRHLVSKLHSKISNKKYIGDTMNKKEKLENFDWKLFVGRDKIIKYCTTDNYNGAVYKINI